jgi:hypothetical protein
MFKAIKEFLFGKAPEAKTEAPYKVEVPAPKVQEVKPVAVEAVVEVTAPTVAKAEVAEVKAEPKKRTGGRKPSTNKTSAPRKGGRKPKAK